MNADPNPQMDLALDYIRSTNKNIFLTGKAGTGKTTFLHRIKRERFKRLVVTAPTGVAAINAGGVTLHSFFQLPFGLFLPGTIRDERERRRFSRRKIDLIRGLDLLVIDEISMVRADLLDAVDDALRRYRDSPAPFGGVQLLMIGDLHQLPPVVQPNDWELLRVHYRTPYFFSSLALEKTEPVAIELRQIYRQSDARFIALLESVRNNRMDATVLDALNSRYMPGFAPSAKDDYITLTAHNASASAINGKRLDALAGQPRTFKARIEGEFPEIAYPTEAALDFKKGAQVMFVKNDLTSDKQFFNGKIGRIEGFEPDAIIVRSKGDPAPISVAPAEWENIRYTLDEATREIREERLGAFTQYPLKLAWAITIHKSQGLTFDRAIVDAAAAFAHGQVYVALSRCRTFEGIVLSSRIVPVSVRTDSVVRDYSDEIDRNPPTAGSLRQSKRDFQSSLLRELFDFHALERLLRRLSRVFAEHPAALAPQGHDRFNASRIKASTEIFAVSDRFQAQLDGYLAQQDLPEENELLRERLKKAGAYFVTKLKEELLPELRGLHLVTDDKTVRKSTREHLSKLEVETTLKAAGFAACQAGFTVLDYVQAQTMAGSEPDEPPRDDEPEELPKDVPHPALYARMRQWRRDTAEALGKEPREILPTRSLEELVRVLPRSRKALKEIAGIGSSRLKRFGPVLLSMINTYCENCETTSGASDARDASDDHGLSSVKTTNTKQISMDLYKEGKSIDEIAAARSFVRTTIEGHLAHFIGRRELDILEFLTKEKIEEISRYFSERPSDSTGGAKAHFGDRYSHGELRMVLEHLRAHSGVASGG